MTVEYVSSANRTDGGDEVWCPLGKERVGLLDREGFLDKH